MKKVLTICTLLVALTCMIVYAGNGITVVDRGAKATKATEVTKAEAKKVVKATETPVDEAKLEEQRMLEALKAADAAEISNNDLQSQLRAAKASGDKATMTELMARIDSRGGSGNLDACEDCNTPNTALGTIGTTVWGYSVAGDMTSEGKWYASFDGEAGATYYWDMCTYGAADADVDIKISDATCTIVDYIDGSGCGDYIPTEWEWTCLTAGTYYVEVADYAYPSSAHNCDAASTTTFTLFYYKVEAPTAFACCYDDGASCDDVADEAACDLLGGTFYPGEVCASFTCPVPCAPTQAAQTDAFVLTPAVAYAADLYDETCLGSYDSGEDDIIEWNVTHGGGWYTVNLVADDDYPGVAVANDCEATDCIVYKTGGSGVMDITTTCTFFAEGTYYIFVSHYSEAPTTFTLTVATCTPPPIGRCCYGDEFAPSCDDMTEEDCLALTDDISWDELLNCQDNECVAAIPGRCCYGSTPTAPENCAIESEDACLARYNAISWTAGVTDCVAEPCEGVVCEEPVGEMSDDCGHAVAVGALPAHMVGDITGMTPIANPGGCGSSSAVGPTVWYSVVGTGNTMTAATCDFCTSFDSYVRVYACDCDNLLCVGSADGGCDYTPGSRASYSWCSAVGEVYLIAVGGYYASDIGMFILDVTDDGVACEDAVVCPTSGACCYNNGADCDDLTEEDCAHLGGDYYPGILCADMECPVPCPFPSADVEPNNDCTTAQTVTCNASYCGELSPSGDVDWYKIVITDPDCQSLTIQIFADGTEGHWPYGMGLDPWVGFYADDCTTLLFSHEDISTGNYDCLIEDTGCLAAGTYYIAIEHNYGTGGPYVMQIDCTPCECPALVDCNDFVLCGTPTETEPNDDCLTNPDATVLECGSTIYGVVCPFEEHDIYQIAVPAMTVVSISLYDGEGCTTIPTECVVNDLIAADCETVYGTGNTGGWTLTNDANVAGFVYLDVYGTSDMCVSTYMIEITCCDIIHGCSAEGLIPVEVVDGSYTYTGNTCCYTDLVPCVLAGNCAGSCYASGPDAVFMLQIVETSLIDQILLTMAADCQMMIFTDCADPAGTCVASVDAATGGNEEFLNLTLDPGIYFLSVSYYGQGACGPYQLDIVSDFSLPVELVDFDAIASDRAVTLNWTTASESNNDRFEVFANGELRGRVDAKNSAIGGEYSFTDESLTNGTTYDYSVVSVSMNGEIEELFTISATPSFAAATITEYALHQNFPNPFNPETKITFDMVDAGFVNLTVYNLLGQKVATLMNSSVDAGRHIVSFEANSLPSGLYLYRMETGNFTAQKKMILMK